MHRLGLRVQGQDVTPATRLRIGLSVVSRLALAAPTTFSPQVGHPGHAARRDDRRVFEGAAVSPVVASAERHLAPAAQLVTLLACTSVRKRRCAKANGHHRANGNQAPSHSGSPMNLRLRSSCHKMMRSGKALPLPAIACGVCGHREWRCRVVAAIRASRTVSNQRSGRGVGRGRPAQTPRLQHAGPPLAATHSFPAGRDVQIPPPSAVAVAIATRTEVARRLPARGGVGLHAVRVPVRAGTSPHTGRLRPA